MLGGLLKELLRGRRARRDEVAESVARGVESQQAGDLAGAEALYRRALQADPGDPEAMHLLGAVLKLQGRLEEAVTVLTRLVERDAGSAEPHFTLASCLHAGAELGAAETHYRRAITLKPGFGAAYVNLSNLLRLQDRMEDAVACLETAIRLDPGSAEAHHNLAKAFYESARAAEALPEYERALALRPQSADMRYNYAEALLLTGELARGWREYEARFGRSESAPRRRPFSAPAWQGEDLAGKTIVVWGEQGIGDELLFAGLYDDLVKRAGRCVFECAAKLAPLLQRSLPRAQVVPRTDLAHPATHEGVDYQSAAGSLARYLRAAPEQFPRRSAYLAADEPRAAGWRRRFAEWGPGLKVGFCWRSSDLTGKRALSCTRLAEWRGLLRTPGVHWVCLQYDRCADELDAARRASGVALHRFDEVDYFDDLDEVAAMMKALDLVVTAPTVVSVQAAALGVAVWQMTYGADWQTHGTQGNPWLPALTRFERRRGQEWSEVLDRVTQCLRERAAGAQAAI